MRFNSINSSRSNDMLVGNLDGEIYDLKLSSTRKALALSGGLIDKVVDNFAENDSIRLGSGFGTITDLVSRPDGLYVLSIDGDLFRVATLGVPGPPLPTTLTATSVPEPSVFAIGALVAIFTLHRPARRQRLEK